MLQHLPGQVCRPAGPDALPGRCLQGPQAQPEVGGRRVHLHLQGLAPIVSGWKERVQARAGSQDHPGRDPVRHVRFPGPGSGRSREVAPPLRPGKEEAAAEMRK